MSKNKANQGNDLKSGGSMSIFEASRFYAVRVRQSGQGKTTE